MYSFICYFSRLEHLIQICATQIPFSLTDQVKDLHRAREYSGIVQLLVLLVIAVLARHVMYSICN